MSQLHSGASSGPTAAGAVRQAKAPGWIHKFQTLWWKQNFKRACIAGVLALIVLLFLWYFWPRSWEDTVGAFAPERVGGVTFYMDPDRVYDSYKLESIPADGPAAREILNILSQHSYRADLNNLLRGTPLQRDAVILKDVTGPIDLHLFQGQGAENGELSVSVYGNGLVWLTGSISGFYRSDTGLFQELADLFQKYGSLERLTN